MDGLDAFLAALRAQLPDVRLLTEDADREAYRHDETAYLAAGLPGAVALPSTTAEVADLLRLASEHRVAVVPRGAGTGLSGGAAGIEGALTIALTRMNQILEIDSGQPVRHHPAGRHQRRADAVARHGLFYRTRRASRPARSAATSARTPAGCAA